MGVLYAAVCALLCVVVLVRFDVAYVKPLFKSNFQAYILSDYQREQKKSNSLFFSCSNQVDRSNGDTWLQRKALIMKEKREKKNTNLE